MKLITTVLVCTALFLMLGACNSQATLSSPGGTVAVKNGKGTGESWGITFEIEETNGTSAGASQSNEIDATTKKEVEVSSMRFGEVAVVMKRSVGGPIFLYVDDKSHGEVAAGSHVMIDKDRGVTMGPSKK